MQKATALSLCLMLAFLHCLEVCAWRTILFFFIFALPVYWDWAHYFLYYSFSHCPLAGTGHTVFLFFFLRTARLLGLGTPFSLLFICALPVFWDWAHYFLVFHFSHCSIYGPRRTIFSFFIFHTASTRYNTHSDYITYFKYGILIEKDIKGFYMNTFNYLLSKIIYIENELDNNDEFINWINRITVSNKDIKVIKIVNAAKSYFKCNLKYDSRYILEYVSEYNSKSNSECDLDCTTYNDEDFSKNAILISTSNQSIRIAKAHNIACVGYVPNRDKFLETKYVIEGFDEIDFDYIKQVFNRFHHIPLTIAETKRCIIREFALEDIDQLFELYSDSNLTRYVEPLLDYEEELEYQKNYIKYMYEYYGYGMWLVFDKENGNLIGRAGLEHRNCGEKIELEIGYLISKEYQGKGIALEVCQSILDFAQTNLDFKTINCFIHKDNIASISLAKKMGFKYVNDNCHSIFPDNNDMQKYTYKFHE